MHSIEQPAPNNAFAALRRFARAKRVVERCDFCSAELGVDHQHLIQMEQGPEYRRIICICDPCAILFGNQSETTFRRVPRRILYLSDFRLTDAQWEGLMIPIQLAFFYYSTPERKVVALYPSPGGLTESLLDLSMWEDIAEANPSLSRLTPDVEGLLVNRTRRVGGAHEYYLSPIDECFKLAGLIRTTWRGLSGGETVWNEIGQFFDDLKARANRIGPVSQAKRTSVTGMIREESHARSEF
jgi:hypothetical protein